MGGLRDEDQIDKKEEVRPSPPPPTKVNYFIFDFSHVIDPLTGS